MELKRVFESLDCLFDKWFEINPEREKSFYDSRNDTEGIKDILHDMEIIDTKSSALLTHISIMFVVIGFFLAESTKISTVNVLFLVEFVAYLVIAMLLLRCIDIMGPPFRQPPNEKEKRIKAYYFEVTLRREIYHRSIRSVYLLTAALIPIICFKFFT